MRKNTIYADILSAHYYGKSWEFIDAVQKLDIRINWKDIIIKSVEEKLSIAEFKNKYALRMKLTPMEGLWSK